MTDLPRIIDLTKKIMEFLETIKDKGTEIEAGGNNENTEILVDVDGISYSVMIEEAQVMYELIKKPIGDKE